MRPSFKTYVVLSCAAVLIFLLLIGYRTLTYYNGPLIDEWHCSEGLAPASNEQGGSACFEEGTALDSGWTWDVLGNRPYDCERRHGWAVVLDEQKQPDCMRLTSPLRMPPEPYTYRDYTIMS